MPYERMLDINRKRPIESRSRFGRYRVIDADSRSLALTRIDVSKIRLLTLHTKEDLRRGVSGTDTIRKLKAMPDYIPLDAQIFESLFERQDLFYEWWKWHTNFGWGCSPDICFYGTTLVCPASGQTVVRSFHWEGRLKDTGGNGRGKCDNRWHSYDFWVNSIGEGTQEVCAVIETYYVK